MVAVTCVYGCDGVTLLQICAQTGWSNAKPIAITCAEPVGGSLVSCGSGDQECSTKNINYWSDLGYYCAESVDAEYDATVTCCTY